MALVVLVAGGITACERPTPLGTFATYAAAPSEPGSIVATSDGTLWFSNTGNGSIGRRSPDGTVRFFFAEPGGCSRASDMAVGPDGNVWFTCGEVLGTITPTGAISNFPAGISRPYGLTLGPDDNLWYVGTTGFVPLASAVVAKRTPAGEVTFYPGSIFPQFITSGPDGNLWYTTAAVRGIGTNSIVRITTAGVATAFTAPGLNPGVIVTGPDGNLWFTNGGDSLGRITPAGAITVFHDPAISTAHDIVVGPDGNLWFTSGNMQVDGNPRVGRITTAGVVTTFSDPDLAGPDGITATPGGMWFTNSTGSYSGAIGHITIAGVIQLDGPGTSNPGAITKGSDDSVWFANSGFQVDIASGVGRIDPNGTTQVFHIGEVGGIDGIAGGADGSAWFTKGGGTSSIGRVTSTGSFTRFTDPTINQPRGITLGRDGNLWFTNYGGNSIGRITPTGLVTAFTDPSIRSPQDITTAADGGMWFTNNGTTSVGWIDPTGEVKTFLLLAQPTSITAVGNDLWYTVTAQNRIARLTPAGVVTSFTDPSVRHPLHLAADLAGNLYFGNNDGTSVGRRTPGGTFTNYAGGPGVLVNDLVGGSGDIWFSNGLKNSITRFGTAG